MKNHLLVICWLIAALTFSQNSGIKIASMDKAINPCTDFYGYCNGTWQNNFQLAASDARYGSFNEINDNNLKKIKQILDAAALKKELALNSDEQRLRDFYNTAMDSVKADELGHSPLSSQLEEIENMRNAGDALLLKTRFDGYGISLFFDGAVGVDMKNSSKNCFGFSQGGFGLRNRDYYYQAPFENIRSEYKKYLSELFQLLEVKKEQADKQAELVFDFEKKLCEKAFTSVELRDYEKMYNLFTISKMQKLCPNISWTKYFDEKALKIPDTLLVYHVEFMKGMDALLKKTTLETLKIYAKAQLLMTAAPYLSSRYEAVHFNFKGKTLSGAKQMKPRWQRVQMVVDDHIGDIVAKEYVSRHFPAEAKQKLDKLIDNLIASYRERIASRSWMSEATKKQANRKLDLLIRKIGYPDKWEDYSGMTVGTKSYWENVCSASQFDLKENLAQLYKPVDRNKWQMTAVTVNAYYDPSTNEITFPAAILQPPFFDPEAEDAANYGTMGSIIGHELTHGFDDQGAQFDAEGNMKMWWTKQDYQNFKNKTRQIINQFDQYVAIENLHVNGNMTQGENIADLGGLTMSYYAYKKSLGGKPSLVLDGLSGEQRFFIAWAQGWKQVTRDEEMKRLLTIDYHSPAYFRAFAPLSNMKEFYDAFGVKEGDKMYTPENKRVEIW
jgi:putative endopeptidase